MSWTLNLNWILFLEVTCDQVRTKRADDFFSVPCSRMFNHSENSSQKEGFLDVRILRTNRIVWVTSEIVQNVSNFISGNIHLVIKQHHTAFYNVFGSAACSDVQRRSAVSQQWGKCAKRFDIDFRSSVLRFHTTVVDAVFSKSYAAHAQLNAEFVWHVLVRPTFETICVVMGASFNVRETLTFQDLRSLSKDVTRPRHCFTSEWFFFFNHYVADHIHPYSEMAKRKTLPLALSYPDVLSLQRTTVKCRVVCIAFDNGNSNTLLWMFVPYIVVSIFHCGFHLHKVSRGWNN